MFRICISGGPCSGKSSIQSVLTQKLEEMGYKTLICPETATELILNGICPSENISLDEFQKLVLDKQLAKEKLYEDASKYFNTDKLVILYDRGLCDQMAYIEKDKFEKLLRKRGLSLSDAMNHYDCVFHLVTAANGALDFYSWNDPQKEDNGNNAARRESPEEAIEKDNKTLEAWIGHPHFRVFDNSTNFDGKIQRVLKELYNVLGIPVSMEIERKFLIKKPTEQQLQSLGYLSKSHIIQTYLKENNHGTERRIRQRGSLEDGFSFFYTEKTDVKLGERQEIERKISPTQYIEYLTEADTKLHQISKYRYCFIYENHYFELDIYPFSDDFAILEVELSSFEEEINFPNLEIIKEVTSNMQYKNYSLARTLSFPKQESEWTYETGRDEPEILGSGSTYYNIERTKDEKLAYKLSQELNRNYLLRRKRENGIKITQYWNFDSKQWEDS